jgi:hypothetical protein
MKWRVAMTVIGLVLVILLEVALAVTAAVIGVALLAALFV